MGKKKDHLVDKWLVDNNKFFKDLNPQNNTVVPIANIEDMSKNLPPAQYVVPNVPGKGVKSRYNRNKAIGITLGALIGLIGIASVTTPIILKDVDSNQAEISSTSASIATIGIGTGDNGAAANAGGADSGFGGETDSGTDSGFDEADDEKISTTNTTSNSTTTTISNTTTISSSSLTTTTISNTTTVSSSSLTTTTVHLLTIPPKEKPVTSTTTTATTTSTTTTTTTIQPECESPQWIGDNYCDDENNFEMCAWDGGDCCGSNVLTDYCDDCECLDPNGYITTTAATTTKASTSFGSTSIAPTTKLTSTAKTSTTISTTTTTTSTTMPITATTISTTMPITTTTTLTTQQISTTTTSLTLSITTTTKPISTQSTSTTTIPINCSSDNPCKLYEGDCDLDSECMEGLECGSDNCQDSPSTGFDSDVDCCGCRSGYTITLDDTGTVYQPDVAGDYVKVNSKPTYRKSTDMMPDYYMYIVEASGSTGKNTFWFISKEIGDTTYLLAGFEPNISCPDGLKIFGIRTGPGTHDYNISSSIAITVT